MRQPRLRQHLRSQLARQTGARPMTTPAIGSRTSFGDSSNSYRLVPSTPQGGYGLGADARAFGLTGPVCPQFRRYRRVPVPRSASTWASRLLATLSDGTTTENSKPLQDTLAELRQVNKTLTRFRKAHGKHRTSNRRERLYCRLYARVSHLCRDHHYKTTTVWPSAAGKDHLGRGPGGVPVHARVQAPAIRHRVRQGGPRVSVLKNR